MSGVPMKANDMGILLLYMGGPPKIGGNLPNHPFLIGFSIISTIHFGGLPPLFLVQHPHFGHFNSVKTWAVNTNRAASMPLEYKSMGFSHILTHSFDNKTTFA